MGKSESKHSAPRRPARQTRPILALACEGQTEYRHANELTRGYPVNLRGKVFPGRHDILLIDDALTLAQFHQQAHPDTQVIPAALYDLEILSNVNLQAAHRAREYAQRNGVHMFVNAPTIERWLLLGIGYKTMRASPRVILQELKKILARQGLPEYQKPGDAYFHSQLALLVDRALERCKNGGHLEGLPCMCEFVKLVRSF